MNIRWFKKPDLKKIFEDIDTYIKGLERQRDTAREQMKEWNKDKEVQKLQSEIELLKKERVDKNIGLSFQITPEENVKIHEWMDEHIEEKHNGSRYAGAIGGRFAYEFIPTSIGDIGYVKCSCGDKFCFRELE